MFGKEEKSEKEIVEKNERTATKKGARKAKTRLTLNANKHPQGFKEAIRLLEKANDKSRGRLVTFADLAALALAKVTPEDIKKLREDSLSAMDRIRDLHRRYNEKHGTEFSFEEFLARELEV